MLLGNWESCVGTVADLNSDQLEFRDYVVNIDTLNGWSCDFFAIELKIVSQFLRRGGWIVYNGYINGQEVCIGEPSFRRSVTIYNQPHNSGIKE